MGNDIRHRVFKSWAGSLLMALLAISWPVLSAQNNPNELARSGLAMRLTGIIINNDSRSALIKIGSAREKIFDQGMRIQDDVTLDAVKDDYVLLTVSGQTIRLELEKSKPSDRINLDLPDNSVMEEVMPAEAPGMATPPVVSGQASEEKAQEQRELEQERRDQEQERRDQEQERRDQEQERRDQEQLRQEQVQEQQELQEQHEEQQPAVAPGLSENLDTTGTSLENPADIQEPVDPESRQ